MGGGVGECVGGLVGGGLGSFVGGGVGSFVGTFVGCDVTGSVRHSHELVSNVGLPVGCEVGSTGGGDKLG